MVLSMNVLDAGVETIVVQIVDATNNLWLDLSTLIWDLLYPICGWGLHRCVS